MSRLSGAQRRKRTRHRRTAEASDRWLRNVLNMGTPHSEFDRIYDQATNQLGARGYADLPMPDGSTMRVDFRG